MARVLSGVTVIEFTKIAVSNKPYTDEIGRAHV